MNLEPNGRMFMSSEELRKIGFSNFSDAQLMVLIAMVTSRPVCLAEAAMAHLQIPLVSRSSGVGFVNTPLPDQRARRVDERNPCFSAPPVDVYCGRPSVAELHNVTLYDCFKEYKVSKKQMSTYSFVGRDDWSNYVYKLPHRKIVRFTDYNPVRHP